MGFRTHKFHRLTVLGIIIIVALFVSTFVHKVNEKSKLHVGKMTAEEQSRRHELNLKLNSVSSKQHRNPNIVEQDDGVAVYEKSPYSTISRIPLGYERESATFFSLVRNSDLYGLLQSIRNVEDRFNRNYHYDWVFANDKPFTLEFKKVVTNLCSGEVKFVNLPSEYWSYPKWIDKKRAKKVRKEMGERQIKYGGSESYRQMCRFNSGLFYKLPVLLDYKYYWRVEPDIEYHCDIDYDPFKYMRENNKVYGFTLAPLELHTTVPTLWDTVKNYTRAFPKLLAGDNNMGFLTDDDGENFNMCHFWSNFEIGDLDFFRSDKYNHFFDYLDQAGGIYYERWGDAPIHTMAVSLLLPKDQLFFVEHTGYYHSPNGDCPRSLDVRLEKNCNCNPRNDETWSMKSCIPKFFDIHGIARPRGAPRRLYKPIHNWQNAMKEQHRVEQLRADSERRKIAKEELQMERHRIELGVEAEQQGEGVDIETNNEQIDDTTKDNDNTE